MVEKIDLDCLEQVKKISVYKVYRNYIICVYCAGSHELYWAFVLFKEKKALLKERLTNCYDVEDGFRYCEDLLDFWEAPITYEEICSWRNICEFIYKKSGNNAWRCRFTVIYIASQCHIHDRRLLEIVGQPRRQILWDKYKIQLLKWDDGWCLKGNWEDKIDFLEKVYILDREPETLPRPWIDKWEAKVKQNEKDLATNELKSSLNSVIVTIEPIKTLQDPLWGKIVDRKVERMNHQLKELRKNIKKAQQALEKYKQVFEIE